MCVSVCVSLRECVCEGERRERMNALSKLVPFLSVQLRRLHCAMWHGLNFRTKSVASQKESCALTR